MSKNADKIVANAKGKIDPKEISNSGTSGFLSLSTGYPSKPIIDYLRNSEQLHYLMGNYTDGVNINGDTTSLSDDQRNYICVTDSRVLIIIGGDRDETFEYKLKRIIDSEFASGIVSSDKLKFNSYNSKGSEDNVIFPIREGSDGKAASRYINFNCKGMAPKTGKSRSNKIAKTNRSSAKTSQSTPSTTGQKDKKRQTSTGGNKGNKKEKNIKTNRSSAKTSQSTPSTTGQKDKKRQTSTGGNKGNKKEKEYKEKIRSLRSDLYKIDSLLTDAEYKQAKQQVDEIRSEISSLKTQVSQKNYDSLDTELQRLEKKCENRLSKSHVLTQLREMDPYDFEKLVAKIWRKEGWDAEVTSGSTDRGVDVIATKDAFEKRRHLIQVKRHGENTTVGSKDIQQYSGLYARRDEQVDNVFVVTSNRFTSEAKEVAKSRGVSVINGDELYEMLTET